MIYHFYHVYADGSWQEPLEQHIDALIQYELRDYLNFFGVGIVGNKNNRDEVKNKLKEYDIDFEVVIEEDSGWEQVTMNKVYEFAKKHNGWLFYAHTKGAHDPSPINIAWRKSMCYYNVVKWKDIEKNLGNMDIDTIGCHWCKNSFWGGTYWWARTSYLASLGYPSNEDRWDAESWIGEGKPRILDLNPGWPSFDRFVTSW